MTKSQTIPWKRIAIEATAIVASILLAFAIDAWWEERVERSEEAELLVRLHSEFVANITRAGGRVYGDLPIVTSAEVYELINAALADGKTTIEVVDWALVLLVTAPTFEADTPVFDGTVRSGRLEIIQDEQVLAALSRWERLLRDYTELAQRTRRNMDAHLIPSLSSRSDFGPILMVPRGPAVFEPNLDSTKVTTIEVDNELKANIAERFRNGRHAADLLLDAQTAAKSVVIAIESNWTH